MAKFEISILNSVNDINFGAEASKVHKVFGDDFQKYEDKELSSESYDYLMKTAKEFAEMTGKPLSNYTQYFDKENELNSDTSDYYSFCRIDYDENDKFEAIEIYSDQGSQLIVDGKDFSSFDLKELLTLAEDFVEEENGTSYTSYTKQIGIWCPDADGRVECILFGKPNYYQE